MQRVYNKRGVEETKGRAIILCIFLERSNNLGLLLMLGHGIARELAIIWHKKWNDLCHTFGKHLSTFYGSSLNIFLSILTIICFCLTHNDSYQNFIHAKRSLKCYFLIIYVFIMKEKKEEK